jgi:hypothetical protein
MKKLFAALIAGAFAMGAMATTPATTVSADAGTPAKATTVVKKASPHKVKVAHKAKTPAKLTPSAT